jgi:hypothetical protein
MRVLAVLVVLAVACQPRPLSYLMPPATADLEPAVGSLGNGVTRALEARYHDQLAPAAAFRLIPTDGSELALIALQARVTITGPLAHTELSFTFHNPEDRTREGRFAIDLPPGAAVGRFAMKVDGVWREARVVARQRGREVYETFLHRRVDPALLEQDVGDRFSARVFPIPARDDKHLVVAYDHVVADRYTLPLSGLPAIPRLAVTIERDGVVTRHDGEGVPPADVVVPVDSGPAAVEAGGAFVIRLDGGAHGLADRGPSEVGANERLVVLVDTSASRAYVMGRQATVVTELAAAVEPATDVIIAAYDHAVTELYRGPAKGAARARHALFAHGALGASDLGAALAWAAGQGAARVVIVGDGVATLGLDDPRELVAIVRGSQIARIDAVVVGANVDRDTLGELVRAGARPGGILDGRDSRLGERLHAPVSEDLPISVAGASRVWPASTGGRLRGDPVFVFGLRPPGAGSLRVTIGTGATARTVEQVPRQSPAREVRRAVARAELAELTARAREAAGPARGGLERQIEEVALAHELMSPQTSLIVLETDADELEMLGPRQRPNEASDRSAELFDASKLDGGGEVVRITSTAPMIDPSSTAQGINIDRSYVAVVGNPLDKAATARFDALGTSFSGATSIENVYIVDGINTSPVGSTGRRIQTMLGRRSWGMLPMPPRTGPDRGGAIERGGLRRGESPHTGGLHEVMTAIARGERDRALAIATRWQLAEPGDVAALLALGEAAEARGAGGVAARAYGSIADLYPHRAELLRVSAERLDRLDQREGVIGRTSAPETVRSSIALYRRALRDRPDHVTGYRLLAYALLRAGRGDEAFDVLLEGLRRARDGRVLRQDARVIAAHLAARDPAQRARLVERLGVPIATRPSLHVVLSWETDANDVDLHIWDRHGKHAFYDHRTLASGGMLVDDVTTGFGPEMFLVSEPRAYPYTIAAHYFDRGPMGLGLGTVQVIQHDGRGEIAIESRPFVIQKDGATVELGTIASPWRPLAPPVRSAR